MVSAWATELPDKGLAVVTSSLVRTQPSLLYKQLTRSVLMLTHERLISVLEYEEETGVFVWISRTTNRVHVGSMAGYTGIKGYVLIGIDGVDYKAHVLAWFYVNKKLPNGKIDHIDTDRSNNKISNLRCATNQQNNANKKKQKNNTSGYKGVSWHKKAKKWSSTIRYSRTNIHLGLFTDPLKVYEVYLFFSKAAFGEFARG